MGIADELQKLNELRHAGVISEDEFALAKARVIAGTAPEAPTVKACTDTDGAEDARRIYPTGKTLEPILAALLSLVFVGLSQMILGQRIKAVVMIVVAIILCSLAGFEAYLFVACPVSAIDAYLIAAKLKVGKSVGEWQFF